MTQDEYHQLDLRKRYVFECYHGKTYYGILTDDQAYDKDKNIKYVVENINISINMDSKLSTGEKIKEHIYIPINIQTITFWTTQN
jgi:hypothetical protein